MRTLTKVVLAVASSAVTLAVGSSVAHADPMDITPDRLALQPSGAGGGLIPNTQFATCQGIAANPSGYVMTPGHVTLGSGNSQTLPVCRANNSGWANLMSELGYAMAPSAFHPARTTGFGGFALSLEGSYAHINADHTDQNGVQYWHVGTQGSKTPDGKYSTTNNGPDSILQIYSLKARKGLPFGFEITGALGYVANSTMWLGGADIHWAILEGYRTGVLGYLPDLSVGGGVRTMSGQSSFYLTTVGIDAIASKPITLADSAVLTPYLGAQRLIIYANSTNVNLAPNVDVLQVCGYQGLNPDGSPKCGNKQYGNTVFNDQTVFQKQTFYRWRGLAGLTYRYELLYLAGQFAMDLEDPGAENSNLPGGVSITGDKQWTMSLEAGVFF